MSRTATPAPAGKVIITCAVTGAIHTPTMSPHLPITPDEIAADAIGAAEAGAAILHLHARNPENGKPDQTPEAFARFLPRVKQGTNAAINITTGGSPYMKVEERVLPAATFKPEVASLNMGSINFGLFHLAPKYETFKFDWEKPHLEATRDLVFRNSFKDIEYILETCYGNGTRFEFECYDIAHLYNLAHFADRGLVKAPFFVQSVFGLLGGIGTHPEDVIHMKRTADRLFGSDFRWSVLGAGASQLRIAAQSAAMGGNVRVGLEDSLWAGKGKLATSSAEQVRMVRAIIEGLGLSIATPDEARAILSLKGGDNVGF
ncbi:3-keto-5-aminohexanoate cleavage protein [Aureimonas sp. SK2]|uniref:3-keto-5-aminohexanoate cleavage protein n=1 Tax=Aureimonas sp. SK2 TaxID=3015992 RepID=UPI0024438C93|nr:3-keto-5-aminohexanoate cleavage protein [Aureimonas sp. SK2]